MKKILPIGFTLFALFFGAGNLIFPLKLGYESASYFWPALIGFLITGVGLPLLGLISGALSGQSIAQTLSERIHPLFSVVFMVAIYLTIGPLFAIPRTATTSYEIGFVPTLGSSPLLLLGFTVAFFGLVLALSLNRSKIVDVIGKWLTPALLITICILCVKAFLMFKTGVTLPAPTFQEQSPWGIGFLEGYLTMDAIAAIAFAMIAMQAVNAVGITDKKQVTRYCAIAALIAGVALAAVYLALGWAGNHYPIDAATLNQLNENGTHLGVYLLVNIASATYGSVGPWLVAVIVLLACLTTAIGLIVAVSDYFHQQFSALSYKAYVWIFTLISLLLANQGLNQVISLSIPVLLILYPIAMTVIVLLLLDPILHPSRLVYRTTVATAVVVSLLSQFAPKMVEVLPLAEASLAWLLPVVAVFVCSSIIKQIKH